MDSNPVGPSDQQPIKRIIGRKTRELGAICIPLSISEERIAFSRQKTRSRIAPKGVFRYKSHFQANTDMEKWISESIQRFEIAKVLSINFHDLMVDRMIKKFANTIDFPYTSPSRYLTGLVALNIPAPERTGGDWHFGGIFDSVRFPDNLALAGEGLEWNTNPVFGDYGIHECSDILRSRGVFIPEGVQVFSANHYRAILDMLYRSARKGQVPRHVAIDDWLDTEAQKKEFFRVLDRFLPKFSPSEKELVSSWIKQL